MNYHKQKPNQGKNGSMLHIQKQLIIGQQNPLRKRKTVFKKLVLDIDEVVANEELFPKPMLAILPKTIASVEKPCKSTVIAYRRSRFS